MRDPRPRQAPRALDLERDFKSISLLGTLGLDTKKACSPGGPLLKSTRVRPNYVIIDLGSNDLSKSAASAEEVGWMIVEMAKWLLQRGVQKVALCSILPRGRRIEVSPEEYRQRVEVTNAVFMAEARANPRLIYHVHRGFWAKEINEWSTDGIHPTGASLAKYRKSIKFAILSCIREN